MFSSQDMMMKEIEDLRETLGGVGQNFKLIKKFYDFKSSKRSTTDDNTDTPQKQSFAKKSMKRGMRRANPDDSPAVGLITEESRDVSSSVNMYSSDNSGAIQQPTLSYRSQNSSG